MNQDYVAPREYPEFFRKQAEHCRWLARHTTDPATSTKLHDMAREFDERAAVMEAGTRDG